MVLTVSSIASWLNIATTPIKFSKVLNLSSIGYFFAANLLLYRENKAARTAFVFIPSSNVFKSQALSPSFPSSLIISLNSVSLVCYLKNFKAYRLASSGLKSLKPESLLRSSQKKHPAWGKLLAIVPNMTLLSRKCPYPIVLIKIHI